MWCDDNYGYITHFLLPKRPRVPEEWHLLSCVLLGRPHDYLWLSTASPYLLYQQMKQAYKRYPSDVDSEMWGYKAGRISDGVVYGYVFGISVGSRLELPGIFLIFVLGSSGLFRLCSVTFVAGALPVGIHP